MTTWINAGAKSIETNEPYATKAALKRALKAAPQDVKLYSTSAFDLGTGEVASNLGNRPNHADEAWTVCGPDPYNSRKWYATVRTNRLGNLVVT